MREPPKPSSKTTITPRSTSTSRINGPRITPTLTSDTRSITNVPRTSISSDLFVDNLHEVTSTYSIKHNISDFLETEETVAEYPGTESLEYAYSYEREHIYSTNLIESTGHLIKGCLGAGILAMHEAYKYGGLWTSFGMALLIGIIAPYNMLMLVKSAQTMYVRLRIPKMSYPDLAEAAVATGPIVCFRKLSRYVLEAFLFLELCGACNIYQIIMSYAFQEIIAVLAGTQLSIRICVLIVTMPILLVCCIRNLKYLAPFSIGADLFMIICVIATLVYSLSSAGNIGDRPAWKSVHGLYHFMGMYIYAIDGMALVLPIENNMTKPIHFPTVVWSGMSVVIISCNVVGFFGYWGWGEESQSPITMNMPRGQVFPMILQFFLVIILPITFSVHFWVPFRIVWRFLSRKIKHKRHLWEIFLRCILVLIITACTMVYPNLHEMIVFFGLVFLPVITLIFPPFIETLIMWRVLVKSRRRWKCMKNLCIILFGLTTYVGGIYHLITHQIS